MATLSWREGAESVERALERLLTLDSDALRLEWRNLFGKRAPKGLPKSLVVRALAYRLQILELGDLDPHTLRVLDAYAFKSAGGRRGRVRVDRLRRTPQTHGSSVPSIKPGSILVREWAGELKRVMVLEIGFTWNGSTYRSLSEVARAITGTRWSGPRFFGLSPRPCAHGADSGGEAAIKRRVPKTAGRAGRERPATRLDIDGASP